MVFDNEMNGYFEALYLMLSFGMYCKYWILRIRIIEHAEMRVVFSFHFTGVYN